LTSNRFFIKKEYQESCFAVLEGEEHHHLSRVARVKAGESVHLFDREGSDYLARVEEIGKNSTRLFVLEKRQKNDMKTHFTLAQALIKPKNFEFVLQKSTELGMNDFIPIVSSRTVVKLGDKTEKKMQRWSRIVLESSKQCGRSVVPRIHNPSDLNVFLQTRDEDKKIFFCKRGGNFLKDLLVSLKPPLKVVLLVGPEGDWTEMEERNIMIHGFEAVSLGPLTLRSETAAISSLAMVTHFWNS
jgi:16S rRNA (uracil1498-N3)-methyltransferase